MNLGITAMDEKHRMDSEEITKEDLQELEPDVLPVKRRGVISTLFGVTVSAGLGYAAYPWLVGDRRNKIASDLDKYWDKFTTRFEKERRELSRNVERRQVAEPSRSVPQSLDANGKAYESFLANLNLRHIKPKEILRAHFKVRGVVKNELPPPLLWSNAAPVLRVADELREALGVKLLVIASAYRCPAYNAACPGAASHSYHLQNRALDLIFDCPPKEVAKAAEILRLKGAFSGGIGRYPTFTHIDTRGRHADWG